MYRTRRLFTLVLLVFSFANRSELGWARSPQGRASVSNVAIGPQYDTTHVYVAPSDVNAFVASFLGTFGGKSTNQVVATVTPTPSSTTSQLLQTPVGTVSLFGFKTPIPAPFGAERTGYLIANMDAAIKAARDSGAEVVVTQFPDPIGVDAVIQFPGGVMTQIYWHTKAPSYAPFAHVPENRVYVSQDAADTFLRSFVAFSSGSVVSDESAAPGDEIGKPGTTFRRIGVSSTFGKLLVLVTDGHLPYPYGRETTGYEVDDLAATLERASSLGAKVLVPPLNSHGRMSAIVQFPGGYIAEIHSPVSAANH
ncbi:VOC family protein [Acidicapsa acidisoli]|uniref:glyoxalase n=1 Tax=Acidicapsa acidisoli TaxID=1615681 RepID=UPI0021DF9F21|nr:glyoxalase [Acidicapsa acidisoli]